jgi:DNA polymerase-4
VSRDVFAVLETFTPFVEELSVDEAFLDISGLRLHYAAPEEAGTAIRKELAERLGLPASVGIATTKFLAKLASEEAKPDGLMVVRTGRELEFLHPLPVRRLWGVGEATHAALEQMAIGTVGDLAAFSGPALRTRLGPSLASHLSALAHGHDPRGVEGRAATKSISVEETYSTDLRGSEAVERALLGLSTRLSGRLHRSGHVGRTVTLKLRFADFTTLTRSLTREAPFEQATDLWDEATILLSRMPRSERGVRLLGLGITHLEPAMAPRQLSITEDKRSQASRVAEEVRARFGADAVLPARLAGDIDAE